MITANITGFSFPFGIAITPDGTKAYVADYTSNTVKVITIASNSITTIIDGFNGAFGIAITPDSTKAYVTNQDNNTISVIDIETNTITTTIPGFSNPRFLAITPDGTTAYVPNQNNDTVSVINTESNSITTIIDGFNGPFSIAITPDGTKAYVTNLNDTIIRVINTEDNTITANITGTAISNLIAITSDGTTAYATNQDNTVSVIDIESNEITNTIIGFDNPFGVAITPSGSTSYAYITNRGNNTVDVVLIKINILPPSSIDGEVLVTTTDITNKITWTPPTEGEEPVSYKLYRDEDLTDLIATVPASTDPLQYLDTNRTTDTTYTYYIVSVGEDASVSESINTSVTTPAILSPSSITGTAVNNIFLTFIDRVNVITWTPPLQGLTPTSYKIYRDVALTQLLDTVLSNHILQYEDNNLQPGSNYNYYIVSINGDDISSPVSITITT